MYTAADLTELPSELPSGAVRYEIDNGRLISTPPPGDEHGAIEANFAFALNVWVADPGARTVTAYEPGKEPEVFHEGDTLTAGELIPGFEVPVAEVFEE